jgi:hypothetical protein
MNQIQLNIDELKGFMGHIIKNNQHIQAQGKVPVAVNVEGDAGLGKTSSIKQLAKEHNMEVIMLNLAEFEELGDLIGFPIKEFKVKNAEGKVLWITEQEIETATQKGYKVVDKRMSHAAPEWIQGKGEGGFLILDDYTRADHRFMQATMSLIDQQAYASWKLPKNWHIILTTNPDNGDYNVTALDIAQKTRFISVEVKFNEKVWAKWAEKSMIDGRCINFMLMNPEVVTQSVNPRAMTTFFNSISSISKFEDELPLIQMIGEGSVGAEVSTLFSMFINNKLDKIISPEEILEKEEKYVLSTLKQMIGEEDEFRADISSVVATRLINYSLMHAETKSVTQDMIDRLSIISTTCTSFTDDLKYYIIKELLNGNKSKFSKLMLNPVVAKMAIK